MMNEYRLQVRTACPVQAGETDLYEVVIRSPYIIKVESIIEFFASFAGIQIFQEDLTRKSATTLGAQVETIGIHSGVTVRSVAP